MAEREVNREPAHDDSSEFPTHNRRRAHDSEIDDVKQKLRDQQDTLERMSKRASQVLAIFAAFMLLSKIADYTGFLNRGPGARIDDALQQIATTNRRIDTLILVIRKGDSTDRLERNQDQAERKRITYELCLISPTGRSPGGAEACGRILLPTPHQ